MQQATWVQAGEWMGGGEEFGRGGKEWGRGWGEVGEEGRIVAER